MSRAPSERFFRDYRLTDGSRAMGQIGRMLEDFNVRMFVLPRRFFLVRENAAVRAGQVLYDGSDKYLLLDHAKRAHFGTRMMRMAQITHMLKWMQRTTSEDLVTGLQREDKYVDKGEIEVALEFVEPNHDNQNRKLDNFRMLCGQPVAVGDRIGEKIIKVVEPMHGVYYAEVQ